MNTLEVSRSRNNVTTELLGLFADMFRPNLVVKIYMNIMSFYRHTHTSLLASRLSGQRSKRKITQNMED